MAWKIITFICTIVIIRTERPADAINVAYVTDRFRCQVGSEIWLELVKRWAIETAAAFILILFKAKVFQISYANNGTGPKVVEHHPGGAGVDHVPQAEVGHPVQEGEDVAPRFLHGQHDDP